MNNTSKSIARLFNAQAKPIGAGFLVSNNLVITCAHVVEQALSLARNTSEKPDGIIMLDFPLATPNLRFSSEVVLWLPFSKEETKKNDIALLKLKESTPEDLQPIKLVSKDNLVGLEFNTYGFPSGHDSGGWASGIVEGNLASGWIQLSSSRSGFAIEAGFSASPLLSDDLGGAFGMIVGRDKNREEARISFGIPASTLISIVNSFESNQYSESSAEVNTQEAQEEHSQQASVFEIGGQKGAFNDLVGDKDQLGFDCYVKAFSDLIESPYTKPPLTIGIFGSWGMGKSFLLEHIIRELNQRYQNRLQKKELSTIQSIPRIHVVEFNAWEYSCAELIWPGLVRKIMNRLEVEVSWGFPGWFLIKLGRNLKHQLKQSRSQLIGIFAIVIGLCILGLLKFKLNLRLIWGAIAALGVSGIFKIVVDTLSKPLSQWITTLFQERNYGKQIGYMAEIRSDLEFLATRLKKDNARILVTIDDLDRCEPQKAVEVLQAVKLLLNFDSFIVSLGIDARIITRAVEEHYKNMLGPAGASGYEYLDKIIQIPFRIPQPNPEEIKVFIARQLFPDEKDEPRYLAEGNLIEENLINGLEDNINSFKDKNDDAESLELKSKKAPFFTSNLNVSPDIINSLMRFLRERFGDQRIQLEVEANGKKLKVQASNMPELEAAIQVAQEFMNRRETRKKIQGNSLEQSYSLVAFTYDELQAFQSLTRFLRPNPRHLKRLVNIYRLVRSLAEYKKEQIILSNPVATIRWLVMCGQWPYTFHAMLWYFDEMLEAQEEGQLIDFPSSDPLIYLLEAVRSQLSKEKQGKLDDDPDLLRILIKRQEGSLSWEQLKLIRQYTVNFNPAVEAELKSEVPVKLNNSTSG